MEEQTETSRKEGGLPPKQDAAANGQECERARQNGAKAAEQSVIDVPDATTEQDSRTAEGVVIRKRPPSTWAKAGHVLVGLTIWGSLAAWVLHALPSEDVDILLAITPDKELAINGRVLDQGKPASGQIQLVLDNPKVSEHKRSDVLDVAQGAFSKTYPLQLSTSGQPDALRITAYFVGLRKDGTGNSRPISGSAVAYTHCSSPIHAETLVKAFLCIGALGLLMVILFTGDLTQQTAKFLFGATYMTCFLSVTAPVAMLLIVSENRYLIELMRESPLGLVRATAHGIEQPQWFLNVGGIVGSDDRTATQAVPVPTNGARAAAAGHNAQRATKGEQHPAEASSTRTEIATEPAGTEEPLIENTTANAARGASDGATTPWADSPPDALAEMHSIKVINGGLAIPFYVIILAVFGAGISMMRNVPDIQKSHIGALRASGDNPILAVLMMLVTPFLGSPEPQRREQRHAGCEVRKKVIDQYMYLLSAPFLAIAVYYLLQVVAKNVAEPVLVLMAFSTGLISERIVSSIVEFANRTLGSSSANGYAGDAKASAAGDAPRPGD